MPNLVKYEGYFYNVEDLTVLVVGEWVKLPIAEVPPLSRALEEGVEATPQEVQAATRTGASSPDASE